MSKDFIWKGPLPPIEQESTNSFLWFLSFIFMFIVMVNAVVFLPSVIAMAFPQLDLSWLFAQ